MPEAHYRLVTRSDFDGLVCALLLRERGIIDRIEFVHPKDMQDGKIPINAQDITTNLPYVAGCHLAFDHHASETRRLADTRPGNHIIDPNAPSAARVVYNYYGGADAFPRVSAELLAAVDKADSAQYTLEEVLQPDGWVLLNFIMDARTGLGRFKQFRVSNYQLMMQLIDYCRDHSIEQILDLPDVRQRVDLYREQAGVAEDQLRSCAQVHGDLAVFDLREEDPIYATNRFMVYALFPQTNISMHVLRGLNNQNTVFAIGKSILKRDSTVHIGNLCLDYGGGGHANAGTCQISNERADEVMGELIARITGAA